jgi:PEP-CTERM motif-containing protein
MTTYKTSVLKSFVTAVALVGILILGHGYARADEVTITGAATGTVTGIPQLTFIGNPNFTNTTSFGIGALSGANSLGTFFLSSAPGQLVSGTFTLDITFTSPSRLIVVDFIRFTATIQGSVSPNIDQGGVFINFRDFHGQNFREERGFGNLENVGYFTMEVPDLFVETGRSAALTAGTTGNQTAIPEPATFLLLGAGLTGITAKLRKRKKTATDLTNNQGD